VAGRPGSAPPRRGGGGDQDEALEAGRLPQDRLRQGHGGVAVLGVELGDGADLPPARGVDYVFDAGGGQVQPRVVLEAALEELHPVGPQRGGVRGAADQGPHPGPPGHQRVHQVAAEEAGGPGDQHRAAGQGAQGRSPAFRRLACTRAETSPTVGTNSRPTISRWASM
jgi:hypothetical protein